MKLIIEIDCDHIATRHNGEAAAVRWMADIIERSGKERAGQLLGRDGAVVGTFAIIEPEGGQ